MYRRGTHDLVGMRTCLVEHKAGRPILESIAELAQGFRIPAYDENTGKGLLRHAIVRIGRVTGQVMVTLVVNRKEFPRKRAFVAALRKRHPSIESVSFNVNTRRTNAVLGPLSMTAYGQGWIEDELCGCTFPRTRFTRPIRHRPSVFTKSRLTWRGCARVIACSTHIAESGPSAS